MGRTSLSLAILIRNKTRKKVTKRTQDTRTETHDAVLKNGCGRSWNCYGSGNGKGESNQPTHKPKNL